MAFLFSSTQDVSAVSPAFIADAVFILTHPPRFLLFKVASEPLKRLVLRTPHRLFVYAEACGNFRNRSGVFKEQPQDQFLPLRQKVHGC